MLKNNIKVKDFDEVERIILFVEEETNTVFLRLKGLSGFRVSYDDCYDYCPRLKAEETSDKGNVRTYEAKWIEKFNDNDKAVIDVFVTVILFKDKILINVLGNGVDETFCYSRDMLLRIFGYSISVLDFQRNSGE